MLYDRLKPVCSFPKQVSVDLVHVLFLGVFLHVQHATSRSLDRVWWFCRGSIGSCQLIKHKSMGMRSIFLHSHLASSPPITDKAFPGPPVLLCTCLLEVYCLAQSFFLWLYSLSPNRAHAAWREILSCWAEETQETQRLWHFSCLRALSSMSSVLLAEWSWPSWMRTQTGYLMGSILHHIIGCSLCQVNQFHNLLRNWDFNPQPVAR